MSTSHSRVSWESLPEAEKIRQWAELLKDAPERIFAEVEKEAIHIRKLAYLRLWMAIGVFASALASTVLLALLDKSWPATGVAGLGSVVVTITLITGREPKLRSSA